MDSTMDVSMTVTDNVAVTKVELYLDDAVSPLTTIQVEPWTARINISALYDTVHTLIAKGYDAEGNIGTATVLFWKGYKHTADNVRMPLIENVTSANCVNCGPSNELFTNNIANLGLQDRIAVIRYHTWWPRSTDMLWQQSQTWCRPRTMYLFSPIPESNFTSPRAWVDGVDAGSNANTWTNKISAEMKVPAEAKITLSKVTQQDSSVVLTIIAKGLTSGSFSDLRLHCVVTESNIEYNDGNSEYVHYEVMRTMMPDADGESFTLSNGEEKTFNRTVVPASHWVKKNLKAVVFIQSQSSKKILQAAKTVLY
jgi:hypothetical protein